MSKFLATSVSRSCPTPNKLWTQTLFSRPLYCSQYQCIHEYYLLYISNLCAISSSSKAASTEFQFQYRFKCEGPPRKMLHMKDSTNSNHWQNSLTVRPIQYCYASIYGELTDCNRSIQYVFTTSVHNKY